MQEKLFFMYGKKEQNFFFKLWDLLTSSSLVCSMAYKYLAMYVQYTILLAVLCQQVERLHLHPVPKTFQKILCEFF